LIANGSLGFDSASPNSHDAVADRDFAVEFLFNCALIGSHLSRLADALILYSTAEFGFVELADAYSTGSSIMPQKKNPDVLELARGKAGTLVGYLTGLLATLKGLPSAYDKDLQEDKAPVFAAFDTLDLLLPVVAAAISTLTVHRDKMLASARGNLLATELADYLVRRGIPFRQAHSLVGRAVRKAIEKGVEVDRLSLAELREVSDAFGEDAGDVLDASQAVAARQVLGGTAPESVRNQIAAAKSLLRIESHTDLEYHWPIHHIEQMSA